MIGIIPIQSICAQARAGIATLYLLPCRVVSALTFVDGIVTAITIDCGQLNGSSWVQIDFEPDTAFFTQTLSLQGRNKSAVQTVTFTNPGMTHSNGEALQLLADECCLIGVVKDNAGTYHLVGVSVYDRTDYEYRDMRVETISGTTGANKAADVSEYVTTLQVTTNTLAPTLSGNPVTISTDCALRVVFGPEADGDVAFGPVVDGDVVFGP